VTVNDDDDVLEDELRLLLQLLPVG